MKGDDGKGVPVEVPSVGDKSHEKEKDKKKKKDKKEKTEDVPKKDKKDDTSKKTFAGGVAIQDFKVGKGPMAKKGDTVRMRYIGKLLNGNEFDKNTSGKPVSVNFIYISNLTRFVSLLFTSEKVRLSKVGMRALLACKLVESEF